MSRYTRITVNPEFLFGQACVRGLPITVSEIVQKVVSGKTVAEILEIWSELDADDVHESLAYAVGDLLHSINTWRFQALKSINRAEEYEHLLLDDELNEKYTLSNAQKRTFAQQLIEETELVEDAWYFLREWANVNYIPKLLWQPKSLDDVRDEVSKHNADRDQVDITWDFSEGLPPVRANTFLADAIYQLATDRTKLASSPVWIAASLHGERVQVSIRRQVATDVTHSNEQLFQSGSPLALAAIIVYQHGEQLSVVQSSDTITFDFNLMTWAE